MFSNATLRFSYNYYNKINSVNASLCFRKQKTSRNILHIVGPVAPY